MSDRKFKNQGQLNIRTVRYYSVTRMHKNRFRGKGTIERDTLISVDSGQRGALFVLGDNYG
jgi:hypothetical protein